MFRRIDSDGVVGELAKLVDEKVNFPCINGETQNVNAFRWEVGSVKKATVGGGLNFTGFSTAFGLMVKESGFESFKTIRWDIGKS